ncbi:MAG TPA: lysylphosphatidylglycerol synthase transmembrane domain-containing protein [Sedimentisphaerales bacterium]|nr:lysylphosphatidylglycerol synthase transmembrane domain-containing protein [Sedimentisphaerales bacterium]HQI28531.1 lysylphosphatidylglycerol synthase transmembrane domain-containing protein [Sedimentisphaerales bacterium]
MSVRAKHFLKLLAKVSVAAALLAWVFSKVDLTDFRQAVRDARWQYLIGVWGSTAMFSWVQSVALRCILKKQDCDVSVNTIFGATCVTSLYGLVVPGFVSTGIKWYILRQTTGKGANVLSAMLYNQIALTVVMMGVGLVGMIVVNPTRVLWPPAAASWLVPAASGVFLAAIVLVSALILNERTGGPLIRLLMASLKPLPEAVREKGGTLLEQIATFQSAGWRFHLAIAAINVVDSLLVGLLWYWFAARAASVVVPTSVLIWLCALVFLLGKLQITVANLGVREVTLVALLAPYGVARSSALLMSMILLSSMVFLAALGLVYQLVWALRSRLPWRPSRPSS